MTIKNSIALATTEQLLDELLRRNALVACSASVLIDGRQIVKSAAEGLTAKQIEAHIEVRALEVMSRAMATADAKDRVHKFAFEPAAGDYSPGSMHGRVELLAVGTRR